MTFFNFISTFSDQFAKEQKLQKIYKNVPS